MQLVALNGFQSNPDTPGCERVVGTWMQDSWLEVPQIDIEAQAIGVGAATQLNPQNVFMVKGWNRSVCALGVLWVAYNCPEFFQAGWFALLSSDHVCSHHHSKHNL